MTRHTASGVVLVVEHDTTRSCDAASLQQAGIKPLSVPSVYEAIDALGVQPIGGVVLAAKGTDDACVASVRAIRAQTRAPIVVLVAHPSLNGAIACMKSGATDVLELPVRPEALVAALRSAGARSRDAARLARRESSVGLVPCAGAVDDAELPVRLRSCARRWSLSAREFEVLELLVQGRPNKSIAAALGLALNTVEQHVSRIFRKSKLNGRTRLVSYVLSSPDLDSESQNASGTGS